MIKKDYRTLFLKEFTKSLIANTPVTSKEVFPYHPVREMQTFREIQPPPAQPVLQQEPHPVTAFQPSPIHPFNIPQGIQTQSHPVKTMSQEINPPVFQPRTPQFQPRNQRIQIKPISSGMPVMSVPENPAISSIYPAPSQLPPDFSLNKLNPLLKDNTVTIIECPGPGKPVLVKSLGRIIPSQIILAEPEIRNIVGTFSNYAKIPVIEGIFKSAVGNLVITAVLSDYVGSRFIINKYTPYSLIEGM